MSAALLDDLLAGYVAPVRVANAGATPAKPAKAANPQHPCGPAADSEAAKGCEVLRIVPAERHAAAPDSQVFAGIRKPETTPQSEQRRGSSQDSQPSQGYPATGVTVDPADLAAVVWTDADIARYLDRRARLMRWGWPEAEAETVAERLVRHDRDADVRASCTDCRRYRPGRCRTHKAAGLLSADLGRDMAAVLQRCPAFELSIDEA